MNADQNLKFAERLRHFIEVRDLQRVEVAKFLGISTSKLGNWLGGRNYPSMDLLIRFCDRYGGTLDYFHRGIPFGLPSEVADDLAKVEAAFSAGRAGGKTPARDDEQSASVPPPKRAVRGKRAKSE